MWYRYRNFNPRPPRGGRPFRCNRWSSALRNFNPRPPRGGRPKGGRFVDGEKQFQSTPPARGATQGHGGRLVEIGISIHAPREGGDRCRRGLSPAGTISIHAPREGGDLLVSCSPHGSCDFNPRPPRGGRRRITQEAGRPKLFQSTPPARGATSSLSKGYLPATGFQSTPPARGATSVDAILPIYYQYFNPRPPRGGRLEPVQIGVVRLEFQSTPPARGATSCSGI